MTTSRDEDANGGGTEGELYRKHLALIDSAFEESEWEGGIATLDILRTPSAKPAPYHIRLLIYLALYPHSADQAPKNEPRRTPTNPNELEAKEQQVPTPEASRAAHDALMAFAHTNAPASLFRALPSYVLEDKGHGIYASLDDGDNEDFDLGEASMRIKEARNVWEFLREGFIQLAPPSRGGVRNESTLKESSPEQPMAVDNHAWEVLEWIVTVMEKDEILTEKTGKPRHSPLLLRQIPPPRMSGGRWDIAMPLEVILQCLQNHKERRKQLGVRLLTMLINLAQTDHMDVSLFSSMTCSRIAALSPEIVDFVLISLPQSSISVQFKMLLCRYLLMDPTTGAANNPNGRPKPVAKQPRAVPRRAGQAPVQAEATTLNVQAASSAPKFRSTTIADILRLLAQTPLSSTLSHIQQLRFKATLVYSFATAQTLLSTEDVVKDPDWPNLPHSGRLVQAVEHSFVPTSILTAEEIGEVEKMKGQLITFIQCCQLDQF
ncbi:hypothetical protein K474DRAFT_1703970 [Panus rudis PR-1116 ss-1]|nr:hypothetical protein K474DRAFT_1703970 [Panus rudis PR-1116 ss-1]